MTEQSQGYGMETYKNFPCGFFARCFLRNDRNNQNIRPLLNKILLYRIYLTAYFHHSLIIFLTLPKKKLKKKGSLILFDQLS